MRKIGLVLAALLLGAAPPAAQRFCRNLDSPRCTAAEFAYGKDRSQRLDFYRPKGEGLAPLMIFIHGGGWNSGDKRAEALNKPVFFTSRGVAFAAVNYRLIPRVTVESQAADVAASIAWLRSNADRLGFDPDRIMLSGHSAGAQLAALVATDPFYLQAAGVPQRSVKGTILLDGSAYDIPRQLSQARGAARLLYDGIFGGGAERQAKLSPLFNAALPNAGAFLILYVTSGDLNGEQSSRLAEALRDAGTPARVVGLAASNHVKINNDLGLEGDAGTEEVALFLRQIFHLPAEPAA